LYNRNDGESNEIRRYYIFAIKYDRPVVVCAYNLTAGMKFGIKK